MVVYALVFRNMCLVIRHFFSKRFVTCKNLESLVSYQGAQLHSRQPGIDQPPLVSRKGLRGVASHSHCSGEERPGNYRCNNVVKGIVSRDE
jgi:hypothetical protein